MSDERIDPILSAWLKQTSVAPPNVERSARSVMIRLPAVRQRRRWWPLQGAGDGDRGRRAPVDAILKLVAAAVVVAVFGGVAVVGMVSAPRAGGPGSSGAGEPDIYWRSNVVDLRADSMTLRIGDETFTTEEADVVVDSSGFIGQFGLYPRWQEGGRTIWLYLDFVSDDERWAVSSPWLWLEGVIRPDETEVAAAWPAEPGGDIETRLPIYGDNVDFDPSGWIGLPLGEAYEGDWRLEGFIEVPVCDSRRLDRLDVTLTFDDLRLEVTPRTPTFLEELGQDWFHRGSMLGDIFRDELERPEPRVLECPESSVGEGPVASRQP